MTFSRGAVVVVELDTRIRTGSRRTPLAKLGVTRFKKAARFGQARAPFPSSVAFRARGVFAWAKCITPLIQT